MNEKSYFAFAIVLLEWYEITIYNLLVPYGIFGGKGSMSIYFGFIVLALSFIARPIGSFYFTSINDRTKVLKQSLLLMVLATMLMGAFPVFLEPVKVFWFGILKAIQGFALGGSYGISYLMVYDNEKSSSHPLINYKLALVQTGWVLGMLLGAFCILVSKLLIGNLGLVYEIITSGNLIQLLSITPSPAFIENGWRIPFLLSSLIGGVLYLVIYRFPSDYVLITSKNPFLYVFEYFLKNPFKILSILFVIGIDMVIAHIFFTYSGVVGESMNSTLSPTLISNVRLIILLLALPIFGYLTDLLNNHTRYGNQYMIALVCIGTIVSGFFAPWSSWLWVVLSALIAAACYGSLIKWHIEQYKTNERQILIGPMFNISGAVFGGTAPLLATWISDSFGSNTVGLIMPVYGVLALVCLLNLARFSRQS